MMKWWGWGDANISFPMHEKPTLWPWIRGKLAMKEGEADRLTPPVTRDQVAMPPPNLNVSFLSALREVLKPDQMTSDDEARLTRCYGKSYPNLLMARRGFIQQAPDLIVSPRSHDDVVHVIELANKHNVCVVPFGGGTNIVGGVDPRDNAERMIVSLDMRQMNKLISVDKKSNIATIEAGALGPKMEKDLQEQGYSLGHYPDSFEYSTLGGWLATRSAGMQSDEYGKIEDMVVCLKMVTPAGTIVTRAVPASSAGPDLNMLMVGSEGVLGVITEATMRVHPAPEVKDYRGFLFKNFEEGVACIREMIERKFLPSMVRLQDEGETELAFNMKAPKKGLEGVINKGVKAYLKRAGYSKPCIMVVGWEGYAESIIDRRDQCLQILKKFHAFPLGKSVGTSWSKDKFNMPYLRDYVMDRAVMCDVSETGATWTNILPLHTETLRAIKQKFAEDHDGAGYVGCHISHTYQTGSCLYFTYAARQQPGRELEQYYDYKARVTDAFMRTGGTLSHHHAIGYEHMPWMEAEVSATGVEALRALKAKLDPKGILNPGKLIPDRIPAVQPQSIGFAKAALEGARAGINGHAIVGDVGDFEPLSASAIVRHTDGGLHSSGLGAPH